MNARIVNSFALTSAYLAHDYSAAEATALGWAREHKSYWLESERPAAWDTFKDLYNNQVGRNIADYVRRNNLSRDQIQDLVLDPAMPFVPSNEVVFSDDRASFGDRFGNWTSSSGGRQR